MCQKNYLPQASGISGVSYPKQKKRREKSESQLFGKGQPEVERNEGESDDDYNQAKRVAWLRWASENFGLCVM